MAERLMYQPLAGAIPACVLACAALDDRVGAKRGGAGRRRARLVWAVLAVGVVAAFTARTILRNGDWTSGQRLWSSSARAAPDSIKIQRALAALVMESDPSGARAGEAIDIAMRGLRILDAAPLPLAHRPAALYEEIGVYSASKARWLAARGDVTRARISMGQAVAMLEQAAEIDREINRLGRERLVSRGVSPGAIADNGTPGIYKNLGWAYLETGEAMEAVAVLGYLRHIRPGDYESHYLLGVAEGGASEFERARGNLREAEANLDRAAVSLIEATLLNPGHAESWRTLERVYGLLAPAPAAVIESGGARALNMEHPLVPGHVRRACAGLVRQLAEAGLRDESERWRQRAINEFGLPPGGFSLAQPGSPESR
jgi:tetratricopeptide (TPR) repeat protein